MNSSVFYALATGAPEMVEIVEHPEHGVVSARSSVRGELMPAGTGQWRSTDDRIWSQTPPIAANQNIDLPVHRLSFPTSASLVRVSRADRSVPDYEFRVRRFPGGGEIELIPIEPYAQGALSMDAQHDLIPFVRYGLSFVFDDGNFYIEHTDSFQVTDAVSPSERDANENCWTLWIVAKDKCAGHHEN